MAQTHKYQRTGGATYHINARQTEAYESPVSIGDTLIREANIGTTTLLVVSDPMVTGYETKWAKVREVGGHHDGNEFGMHFTHQW